MRSDDAIRHYFGQPGFQRFLELLKRQYVASGNGVRGYATLERIAEQERSALDTFYRAYSPHREGETKRYSLKKFEALLKDSRFELTVAELLEVMFGTPVLTRKQQEEQTDEAWRNMLAGLKESVVDGRIIRWLEGLSDETALGTRTLRLVFCRSPEEARVCLHRCIAALSFVASRIENKPIRLPILAAKTAGDAHALDWKQPAGRLFWWGLASIQDQPLPMSELAEEEQEASTEASSSQSLVIREGYRRGGVADDDISSQVLFYSPKLTGLDEECIMTLRQVERISGERLANMGGRPLLMVENPSVFAELVDAALQRRIGATEAPVILCGNGQPSTAVLRLLDWLLSFEGAMLYYAGDLDAAGLGIAQGLQLRYPHAFRPWRMDAAQYSRFAHMGIPLAEAERSRLQEGRYAWDAELAATMLAAGRKLHQELWVEELMEDCLRWKL